MWVSVCVRGWVAKEGILSPASLKTFFCLFLYDTQRAVPAKTYETGREGEGR